MNYLLRDTSLTKEAWIALVKSLKFSKFYINGNFLSKDESVEMIGDKEDEMIEFYHFEAIE